MCYATPEYLQSTNPTIKESFSDHLNGERLFNLILPLGARERQRKCSCFILLSLEPSHFQLKVLGEVKDSVSWEIIIKSKESGKREYVCS